MNEDSRLTVNKEPIDISCLYPNECSGRKFRIEMNEYQLTNLLWALKKIYHGDDGEIRELSTGDWVGEIPNKIDYALDELGIELWEPNG